PVGCGGQRYQKDGASGQSRMAATHRPRSLPLTSTLCFKSIMHRKLGVEAPVFLHSPVLQHFCSVPALQHFCSGFDLFAHLGPPPPSSLHLHLPPASSLLPISLPRLP